MAMLASFWILLMVIMNASVGGGQSVQMDAVKSGFVGSTVELRCLFINSKPPVKISQVTWQKFQNGTKQNVAIANPNLGVSVLPPFKDRVSFKYPAVHQSTPSLEDTTIVFTSLHLSDEATYICEYTTFPAGNRENTVNLTVYARPVTQMTLTVPTIVARRHNPKMTVATCLSANGKPPGDIKWETQLKGESTLQESRNANGTVTLHSSYELAPSRETHGQKLTCVVTYRAERFADTVVLNVQYEPDVTVRGFDGNWYLNRQDVKLICDADANPAVTVYQWKLLNGSLPRNAEIRNNTLFFKGAVTHEIGGTYVCDATNSIGTRSGLVEVNVTEKPVPQGSPTGIFGILGVAAVVGLIAGVVGTVCVVYKRGQKPCTETDGDQTDLPPAHKPDPPRFKKKYCDGRGGLAAGDIQVVHLGKEEEMQKLPLQPPYYDMAQSEPTTFTDKQNLGGRFAELPNPADRVTHQLPDSQQHCLELRPPLSYPPVTFLPRHLYPQPPTNTPMYTFRPNASLPGPRPPYPFHNDQSA